jgi:hypothetical protein
MATMIEQHTKDTIEIIKERINIRKEVFNTISTLKDFNFKLTSQKFPKKEQYSLKILLTPKISMKKEDCYEDNYFAPITLFSMYYNSREEVNEAIKIIKQKVKDEKL